MAESRNIVATARHYWDAEQTRDVERILAAFHPDAVWTGPSGEVLRGREQIRRFYESSGAQYPGLVVEIGRTYSSHDEGAIEWHAELTDLDGSVVLLSGVNIMSQKDGLITALSAYFDGTVFS